MFPHQSLYEELKVSEPEDVCHMTTASAHGSGKSRLHVMVVVFAVIVLVSSILLCIIGSYVWPCAAPKSSTELLARVGLTPQRCMHASTSQWSQAPARGTQQLSGPPGPAAVFCGDGSRSGSHEARLPSPPLTLRAGIEIPFADAPTRFIGWNASGSISTTMLEFGLTADGNLRYGERHDGIWSHVLAIPTLNLTGSWHSVSVVRDELGLVHLFADGALVGQGVVDVALPRGIVQEKAAGPAAGRGPVVDLRIYDRALQSDDLTSMRMPCQLKTKNDALETSRLRLQLGDRVMATKDISYGLRGTVAQGTKGLLVSDSPHLGVLWDGYARLQNAVVHKDQVADSSGGLTQRAALPAHSEIEAASISRIKEEEATSSLMAANSSEAAHTSPPVLTAATDSSLAGNSTSKTCRMYCSNGGWSGPLPEQAISFPDALLPRPPLTVTAEIRSAWHNDARDFVAWRASSEAGSESVEFQLDASGNLAYGEFGAHGWHHVDAHPAIMLADDKYHKVAVVRDEWGYVLLYADGALVGQGVLPRHLPVHLSANASSSRRPEFWELKQQRQAEEQGFEGRDESALHMVWKGGVKNVRIYNGSLTGEHVAKEAVEPC